MIRVNMLGRACAAVALLAFVVVVYRLHSLASRLEHDLQMRHIARDMLRDDELDSHSAGIASSAISAREHDAHAQVGRTTDEAAHPANAAEQSRAPGGRWAGLEELHRDWDMYVVNLDKRPDRLACIMQEFNRLGMRVNRLRGIDGTQLDLDDLSLVTPEYHSVETGRSHDKKHSMVGHKGCLYSHLHFLLRAVGQADCFAPQYLHSLSSDPNIGEVTITVTNAAPVSLRVYRVNTEGEEMLLVGSQSEISPQGTIELLSGVNEVWRFRAVSPAEGVPERLLGEVLVDRYPATREFVVTDCPSVAPPADNSYTTAGAFKGAIMFEDDVVFDADFVPRFLKASAALPDDWDVLMLNWYCMGTHAIDRNSLADVTERLKAEMQKLPRQADTTQSQTETTGRRLQDHHTAAADGLVTDTMLQELINDHALLQKQQSAEIAATTPQRKNPTSWTQWCEKNRGTPEIVPGSGLVKAHFFMSGSAFVVSPSGARKILESFPCHDVGELKCSPAFDFHLSSLVERGLVNAYGMLPEAVWMPKQGELLGIEPGRYTVPSSVRTSASCISYTSDIFAQPVDSPNRNEVGSVTEDQARAKAIEQTIFEYRGALRRKREGSQNEAGGNSRLRCDYEENVVYDVHSHTSDGERFGSRLHEIRLGRAEDCCLACIAEPQCQSWSLLVGLRYCQLNAAEVGPPGSDGQSLGRKQSENVVSGRLVRA